MLDLTALYRIAEDNGIKVRDFDLEDCEALAMKYRNSDYVVIDSAQVKSSVDEKMKLGHEIGHCITGGLYLHNSPYSVKKKCENRADKWAIERLVPLEELNNAAHDGYTEIWELAEHFDVTEDFVKKSLCWYLYGTLDTENYFAS